MPGLDPCRGRRPWPAPSRQTGSGLALQTWFRNQLVATVRKLSCRQNPDHRPQNWIDKSVVQVAVVSAHGVFVCTVLKCWWEKQKRRIGVE